MPSRRLSLAVLAIAATAWSGLLALSGLWLLLGAGDRALVGQWPRIVGGITAIGAGLLVFMCLVADRIFPRASRLVVSTMEVAASVVVFLGVAWLSVMIANLLAPGW